MTDDWPVEIRDFDYHPIPESWLEHPRAYASRGPDGPVVYAVSAATYGSKTLRIRYIHPATKQMHGAQTAAKQRDNGAVPLALVNGRGWPRSKVATMRPVGAARNVEIQHFRELWEERLEDELDPRAIADGGNDE